MTDRTCPVCGEDSPSVRAVQSHCWDAHSACHHCGQEFEDRESLYTHWLVAHEDQLSSKDRARAESTVGELTTQDRVAHQGAASALSASLTRRRVLLGGVLGAGGLGTWFLANSLGGGGTLEDHPASKGIRRQPVLGPPPGDGEGTVVAFEDPSCPSCARFERRTFPRLRSELIESGRLSFVFRGIPVVFPWGETAVHALEATYARDPESFWALKTHYYRNQPRIGGNNVRSVTREFLATQTDVDAAAVLADVSDRTQSDAVEGDVRASEDAGVGGTPTFFLFRDGSFVTDLVGAQSYEVFANTLGM
jgi:protein-disulfide isomerase